VDTQHTLLHQPTLQVNAAATENIAQQPTAQVSAPPTLRQTATVAVSEERANRGGKFWVVLALVIVCVVFAAILFATKILSPSDATKTPTTTTTTPINPVAEPERLLTYAITVQKDPKRYPGSKPFQLPGEVIFSAGDRVRFTFASPQAGFLYILNESPELSGGKPIFNVLFPSSTSNNNSAELSANQTVQIPERGDGFIFDAEEGTEKLWLVWSANALADLESLKRWANPEDKGEIKDATQADSLRDFLLKNSSTRPEVEKDEVKKQSTVKGKGDLLVKLINLEHH
jgi:hypothetical protein